MIVYCDTYVFTMEPTENRVVSCDFSCFSSSSSSSFSSSSSSSSSSSFSSDSSSSDSSSSFSSDSSSSFSSNSSDSSDSSISESSSSSFSSNSSSSSSHSSSSSSSSSSFSSYSSESTSSFSSDSSESMSSYSSDSSNSSSSDSSNTSSSSNSSSSSSGSSYSSSSSSSSSSYSSESSSSISSESSSSISSESSSSSSSSVIECVDDSECEACETCSEFQQCEPISTIDIAGNNCCKGYVIPLDKECCDENEGIVVVDPLFNSCCGDSYCHNSSQICCGDEKYLEKSCISITGSDVCDNRQSHLDDIIDPISLTISGGIYDKDFSELDSNVYIYETLDIGLVGVDAGQFASGVRSNLSDIIDPISLTISGGSNITQTPPMEMIDHVEALDVDILGLDLSYIGYGARSNLTDIIDPLSLTISGGSNITQTPPMEMIDHVEALDVDIIGITQNNFCSDGIFKSCCNDIGFYSEIQECCSDESLALLETQKCCEGYGYDGYPLGREYCPCISGGTNWAEGLTLASTMHNANNVNMTYAEAITQTLSWFGTTVSVSAPSSFGYNIFGNADSFNWVGYRETFNSYPEGIDLTYNSENCLFKNYHIIVRQWRYRSGFYTNDFFSEQTSPYPTFLVSPFQYYDDDSNPVTVYTETTRFDGGDVHPITGELIDIDSKLSGSVLAPQGAEGGFSDSDILKISVHVSLTR